MLGNLCWIAKLAHSHNMKLRHIALFLSITELGSMIADDFNWPSPTWKAIKKYVKAKAIISFIQRIITILGNKTQLRKKYASPSHVHEIIATSIPFGTHRVYTSLSKSSTRWNTLADLSLSGPLARHYNKFLSDHLWTNYNQHSVIDTSIQHAKRAINVTQNKSNPTRPSPSPNYPSPSPIANQLKITFLYKWNAPMPQVISHYFM